MKQDQINGQFSEGSAEDKILLAAREVFVEKGFDGARMQEIADVAGINKALLHYYFRSKDKLFMAVFESSLENLIPSMEMILNNKGSIQEKLRLFFEVHLGFLLENPMIPRFIITEFSMKPDRMHKFFSEIRKNNIYLKISKIINDGIEQGEIKPIEPLQLLLNIVSLSVFPVLAGQMITGILDISEEEYKITLEKRKKEAADFVIKAIS